MWNPSTRGVRRRLISSLTLRAGRTPSSSHCRLDQQLEFSSPIHSSFAWPSSANTVGNDTRSKRRQRPRPLGRELWSQQHRDFASRKSTSAPSPQEALRAHVFRIEELRQESELLPPLGSLWEDGYEEAKLDPDRQELYRKVLDLVKNFEADVERGIIQPAGRHYTEVSIVFEWILRCLVLSYPEDGGGSLYQHSVRIMQQMASWKIALQHSHSQSIMIAAGREGRWKDAARLFASRIDPAANGLNPADTSVSNPVGLYCIARYAQEGNGLPVESVFNGVTHMSIVSPSDQGMYVLAAGTALGHAGEAEALLEYLATNPKAKEFGQFLDAAAMHACLLSNRPDDALALFDNLIGGDHQASVEWQWEGGKETLLPVCRDLAIRALGASTQIKTSTESFEYYAQIEKKYLTMSFEAFLGILRSCEKDREWKKAIDFFFHVTKKHMKEPWLVDGSNLEIPLSDAETDIGHPSTGELIDALNVTMQACNASGQFGSALLCAQRFGRLAVDDIGAVVDTPNNNSNIVLVLQSLAVSSPNAIEFLKTVFSSLSGAQLTRAKRELHRSILDMLNFTATELEEIAQCTIHSNDTRDRTDLWEQVLERIETLVTVKKQSQLLTVRDRINVSIAVGQVISQSTNSGEPGAALVLLARVLDEDLPLADISAEMLMEKMRATPSIMNISDGLISSIMEALVRDGSSSVALDLFGEATKSDSDLRSWSLSSNVCIKALFDVGRKDDALALFNKLIGRQPCHGIFVSVAEHFFSEKDDENIFNTYQHAVDAGCISEDLSVLAIASMSRSKGVPKKMEYIKDMVGIAARIAGDPPVAGWAEKHYWHLKQLLPFTTLRWLLRWSRKESASLDELELALKTMQSRASSGLNPNLDSLRVIANVTGDFHDEIVPPGREELMLIPRTRDQWAEQLRALLLLAKHTALHREREFINNAARGLAHLGCQSECLELVVSSLLAGVELKGAVLVQAKQIAKVSGAEEAVALIDSFILPANESNTQD